MADGNIDTSFQEAIDAGKIHGAILCATDAEGKFTFEKTIGERTLLSGEKVAYKLDDFLYLASATKLITAIAALQCVEDGLLSLTGDLSAVAPELAEKQVLTGFSEDGETPILEPQARPITLEMLLTHSSGLVYHFLNPLINQWREKARKDQNAAGQSGKRTIEELFDYPLAFQPGSAWLYGPGLDWAGRIVERVTGQRLLDRMRARIFEPLGIADAEFYPVVRADLRARMPDLNPADPDAVGLAVLGGNGDMNRHTRGDFGGHGLFMTAPGYLRVLRSLLANDGRILQPATVDGMFEHRLTAEATASHRARLAGPMGLFFRVGTAVDARSGHGLGGLLTLQDVAGWYGERTLSWGGGLTFTWFVDRQNDLCGVGAVQALTTRDEDTAEGLKDTFRHDIYRKREGWKKAQSA
ncbi:putative transesterase [Daldinia caldariorum]|uniref:putative transesterase n=1 Tax=Daldinia caldariorum TaxID=326644 RepID=UPI0020077B84|nr:putative transesterase [Daldinia caldariorum]KAI1465814.1 putative transesterase [Daldinia caldariorum]